MTTTFLRKYWITLTSLCTIGATVVLACAGDWGPEYGTSSFTPQAFVDSAYSPFFYSNQFYYGIGHDEDHINRWKAANIADWTAWLNKTLTPQLVDYFLNTAGPGSLDSAITHYKAGDRPALFIKYLSYAKKCEAFALNPIQQAWEIDSTKPKPHFDASQLNRQLSNQLTTATDPFIQERYWFQLVRSQFFNSGPEATIKLFDAYSAKFPHNNIWYRTLAYSAGAYYKQKQYSKANYIYSRVFDSCNELKTVAHYSFHPQEEADWQTTLALCRNTEEKATLWQMLGIFYSDPQRAITRIYELDPRSEKLDLLLSRAINTAEQRHSDADRFVDMPGNYSDSSTTALLALVSRIAAADNTDKPWAWYMAAGYLNTLNNNYTAAATYLKKAESLTPHIDLPQAQLRLLRMINTLASAKKIDHSIEQKLLPDIQWLETIPDDKSIRSDYAFNWLKKTMAAKYRAAGDKLKSECFVTTTTFYSDSSNVEALKAFLGKSNKTPYEQLCAHLSTTQYADIFEYQAVLLTMSDRLDEALTAMKQVPSAATAILPGNPFNARIVDCHDCDHEATQKIKYSKLAFLQKLKELKDKIAAGADVYTNAILMANAQYNITQYGNARVFYEGRVFGSDHSEPRSIDSVFRMSLMDMTTAMKYYLFALSVAQTDEQRAKCQYLLAKCQRNEWYNKNIFSKDDYDYNYSIPNFAALDGFKALKQYPTTQYYKEVLKECGYFRSFIHQNK